MVKNIIHDRIPRANTSNGVDTFIKKGHDPYFFFEIFFRFLFFIQLRISSRQRDFHVDEPLGNEYFIDESHNPNKNPDNDDK